jgi:hypothetical protein
MIAFKQVSLQSMSATSPELGNLSHYGRMLPTAAEPAAQSGR